MKILCSGIHYRHAVQAFICLASFSALPAVFIVAPAHAQEVAPVAHADQGPLYSLPSKKSPTRVTFSSDGKLVVTASTFETPEKTQVTRIELFEASTGKPQSSFTMAGFTHRIELAPDNKTLAVANNGVVSLWNMPAGTLKQTFASHTGLAPSQTVDLILRGGSFTIWSLGNLAHRQAHRHRA